MQIKKTFDVDENARPLSYIPPVPINSTTDVSLEASPDIATYMSWCQWHHLTLPLTCVVMPVASPDIATYMCCDASGIAWHCHLHVLWCQWHHLTLPLTYVVMPVPKKLLSYPLTVASIVNMSELSPCRSTTLVSEKGTQDNMESQGLLKIRVTKKITKYCLNVFTSQTKHLLVIISQLKIKNYTKVQIV